MKNILYFAMYNICRKKYRTLYVRTYVINSVNWKKRNERTKHKFAGTAFEILAMELIAETRKSNSKGEKREK